MLYEAVFDDRAAEKVEQRDRIREFEPANPDETAGTSGLRPLSPCRLHLTYS